MLVTYTKGFLKQFEKYDKKLQQQIVTAIEKLPDGDVCLLKGKNIPKIYRLRVRTYRILFEMTEHEIVVWAVDSRGDVYKNI